MSLRGGRCQFLSECLHFATDDRLGEFGVMARHVGVRVTENLGQYVDRHSIFDGHTGEGVAGFALELVNDEIKRDAVKFNGLFTVYIPKKQIYVKSEEPKKCNLISFSHSIGLDKVRDRISSLNASINDFINDTVNDAKKIKVIDTPDLFREYILMKVQNSKNIEFNKNYRDQVKQILSNKVRTIFELASLFEKVELLIEDDHIMSLDFWRHKLYQVLMDGVKGRN